VKIFFQNADDLKSMKIKGTLASIPKFLPSLKVLFLSLYYSLHSSLSSYFSVALFHANFHVKGSSKSFG
jgi:hypothetical protein